MVLYVADAVVAVTVMHVLLFVLHVCLMQEVRVRARRQCCYGVRWRCGYGECIYGWYTWFVCLASACDVLEMSVVRGVGGVCDMCMCLARGGVGGVGDEWVTGLGLGFTNSGGTWGKWDICVFWLRWCGCCWGRVGKRLGPGFGRVVFCLCVL